MPLNLQIFRKRYARACLGAASRCIRALHLTAILLLAALSTSAVLAGEVFIYSSQTSIRGLDLDQGTDRLLSNSPISTGVNALAYNLQAGIIYYGNLSSVYRWDPALGSGVAAHTLMNDFSAGPLTADITNLNSTAGAFIAGKYYVGSESNLGYIKDLYELTMSVDGTQVVSVQPLNILTACGCSQVQLGGFGDVAVILEGGVPVLYGSSADLSGTGAGTSAGRWKFTPSTSSFQLLAAGTGGQMSGSPSGLIYSNQGNAVRQVDKTTGLLIGPTLITTTAPIYDFSAGFTMDFGDAPDSYGSAFHRLGNTSAYIGALAPDNEAGSLNIIAAGTDGAGDDNDGIDDEDAVSGTVALPTSSNSYALTVQCSAGARVSGWIDININGKFDTNERNANHPVTCASGQATLNWTGLFSAIPGATYMRLRASTNASAVSTPTGVASDGETEDHPVVITADSTSGNCPAGSTSHTYSANDLPVDIGPNANTTAVSTISVTDTGTIVDVNVLEATGTHSYINDLTFKLRHAGTTRTLYGPSCGSQNNFSFGFDDAASGTAPCPPTDGNTYPSSQSLAQFNGQSISGDWQLRIEDRFNADGGALQTFRLELCTSGGGVVESPDIIIGKAANVVGQQVDFTVSLINSGNVALSGLSVTDDLVAVFGAGNYSIATPPAIVSAPTGFVVNTAFNGAADKELIASSLLLLPNEQVDITFSVNVNTIENTATPGRYSNQAVASATSPSTASVTDLSGTGLNLAIDTDDATEFAIDTRASLSGYVFEDTLASAATAHDGVKQTNEVGLANRVVKAVAGDGTVISSTVSDAGGYWQLSVDEAFLNQAVQVVVQPDTLSSFVSEASLYSVGSVSDGIVSVTPGYGEKLEQINIGLVNRPVFTQDHSVSVSPGDVLSFSHRFTASTFGNLAVTTNTTVTPVSAGWSTDVYLDANCNELLDTSEGLFAGSAAMNKDDELCLLVNQLVPATAVNGTVGSTSVNAQLTAADNSNTGHGLTFDLFNQDVITVVRVGAGRLELEKTVRNITLGGAEVVANTGLPGHVLEYSINYRNAGDGPLTELSIDDAAPAFTQVVGSSASCDSTPASVSCVPSQSGASVNWLYSGTLAAGQQGSVSYQVVID